MTAAQAAAAQAAQKDRRSGRLKGKVKVAGGRIDDETRRLVHQSKLNSLENDDYQRLHEGEEDADEENERRGKRSKKDADEEYVDEDDEEVVSTSASSKKRKRASKSAQLEKVQKQKVKSSFLPIRKWEDIQLELQDEADEDERNLIRLKRAGKVSQDTKAINYFSIAAPPSRRPGRHFCSVCGYTGNYSCVRCGLRFCSIRCQHTHKETRCLKFTA